jgi:hypothetical protein
LAAAAVASPVVEEAFTAVVEVSVAGSAEVVSVVAEWAAAASAGLP